jgi:hypothetical protein
VTLATHEDGTKPSFAAVLRGQIKALRKQLDKSDFMKNFPAPSFGSASPNFVPKRPARPNNERDIHALLDALSDSIVSSRSTTKHYSREPPAPSDRDFRLLLDKLSESVASGDMTLERAYSALRPSAPNTMGWNRGEAARHQPMRVAQRLPGSNERGNLRTPSEPNFPELSNIADRAIYQNEIRLSQPSSGNRSTFENYNYPEFSA